MMFHCGFLFYFRLIHVGPRQRNTIAYIAELEPNSPIRLGKLKPRASAKQGVSSRTT